MKVKIFSDGFEGHVRRSLARADKMARGERLTPERIFTFADPVHMLECLTAERVRLCRVVRKKRLSISALAEELGPQPGFGDAGREQVEGVWAAAATRRGEPGAWRGADCRAGGAEV